MNNYIVSLKLSSSSDDKATQFAQFLIDTLKVYQKESENVSGVQIALTKVEEPSVGE